MVSKPLDESSLHYHTIEFKGNLILESNTKNFRAAFYRFLNSENAEEGIQLQIKDASRKDTIPEDIVVVMSLAKMKQSPMIAIKPDQDVVAVRASTVQTVQTTSKETVTVKVQPKIKVTTHGIKATTITANGEIDTAFY